MVKRVKTVWYFTTSSPCILSSCPVAWVVLSLVVSTLQPGGSLRKSWVICTVLWQSAMKMNLSSLYSNICKIRIYLPMTMCFIAKLRSLISHGGKRCSRRRTIRKHLIWNSPQVLEPIDSITMEEQCLCIIEKEISWWLDGTESHKAKISSQLWS